MASLLPSSSPFPSALAVLGIVVTAAAAAAKPPVLNRSLRVILVFNLLIGLCNLRIANRFCIRVLGGSSSSILYLSIAFFTTTAAPATANPIIGLAVAAMTAAVAVTAIGTLVANWMGLF